MLGGAGEDPRRNIDEECGYPQSIDPEDYRKLYDREPVASRVVQVMPLECWQVSPHVYEDEDVDVITPFEQAWNELGKTLRGGSKFQDDAGNPVWEYLLRADILSGIGSYGIILLGIDDGKKLDEPADLLDEDKLKEQQDPQGFEEEAEGDFETGDQPEEEGTEEGTEEVAAEGDEEQTEGETFGNDTEPSPPVDYGSNDDEYGAISARDKPKKKPNTLNFDPNQPRDAEGQWTSGGQLHSKLHQLRGKIAQKAQEEYDAWDQSGDDGDEECGFGGICDRVSGAISDVVVGEADVDVYDGGQDGDDHAYPIFKVGKKAYGVDIHPSVYETGGGYSWKKKEGVKIEPDDVEIFEVDADYLTENKLRSLLKKKPFTLNDINPRFRRKPDEEETEPGAEQQEVAEEEEQPRFAGEEETEEVDPETVEYAEDGQPVEGILEDGEEPSDVKTKRKLLYVRVYDETLVQIVQYESDPTSPRYGQPVMYDVTINDPKLQHAGSGLAHNNVRVHWTRIIHVADNLQASEIFGTPRMMPVYNRLMDLKKLHSGSAEMYWKGAFPGFNLMTHPQLGGDVSFDTEDIKAQMEQYMNGLQRYTAFIGMSMNSLAPQVVDPASQIQVQLEAICIRLGVPMRVFMGSERGELASSQDTGTWNGRLKQRHNGYLTPRLIVPFIDRLIEMEVLPTPKGYSVVWEDLASLSDMEKASKAAAITTALAGYVSGGIENIMTLQDYLVRVIGWDEAEAAQIEENARIAGDDMLSIDPAQEQEMMDAQMEQMTNPELVPDNIQTGDQHHYEAGSMDKQAELEHERLQTGANTPPDGAGIPQGQGQPEAKGQGGALQHLPPKAARGKRL